MGDSDATTGASVDQWPTEKVPAAAGDEAAATEATPAPAPPPATADQELERFVAKKIVDHWKNVLQEAELENFVAKKLAEHWKSVVRDAASVAAAEAETATAATADDVDDALPLKFVSQRIVQSLAVADAAATTPSTLVAVAQSAMRESASAERQLDQFITNKVMHHLRTVVVDDDDDDAEAPVEAATEAPAAERTTEAADDAAVDVVADAVADAVVDAAEEDLHKFVAGRISQHWQALAEELRMKLVAERLRQHWKSTVDNALVPDTPKEVQQVQAPLETQAEFIDRASMISAPSADAAEETDTEPSAVAGSPQVPAHPIAESSQPAEDATEESLSSTETAQLSADDRINSITNQERDDFDYNGNSQWTLEHNNQLDAPLTKYRSLFLLILLDFHRLD